MPAVSEAVIALVWRLDDGFVTAVAGPVEEWR
jgi:hypothetical protein